MANTCDDAFQEIQALQQRKAELERQLQDSERARKAGERFTREEVGNKILLPGRDGTVRELDDKEISRGLGHWADAMESDELADFVKDYDGVKVVVDRASSELVQGAEIDFVEGLQGAGFKINNPNVTKSCGCGQSFN